MNDNAGRIASALENIARSLQQAESADLATGTCWRWEATADGGHLRAFPVPALESLSLLHGLDEQISLVDLNTRSFLRNRPANHVLLTGPRGTGKSSVVRGVFAKYLERGLRLIETDAEGLAQLPLLLTIAAAHNKKFIIYCDDLSFGRNSGIRLFQRLKSALEGGLATAGGNVRVYATSNRRHLTADYFSDTLAKFNEEIHGGETIEETTSLSDRFGLWVPFFELTAAEYEQIAGKWLNHFGLTATSSRIQQARRWAAERGSMNGRLARHFAVAAANKTAL